MAYYKTYQDSGAASPAVRDEHVLVSLGMAPFRVCQRTYRHLSSVPGFGIIATLMSVYCMTLSVETVMIALPGAFRPGEYTEEVKRSKRFVPKPYVNDGAELGRLNPWPNIQQAVLQKYFSWLPLWVRGQVERPYWTVWSEPGILVLSTVITLVIQHFEAKIFRKRSIEATQRDFRAANAVKQVQADPKAIALAHYKAQQHNAQGMGGVLGTFVAVVLLYGLEFAAFFGSFAGAGSWVINTVYGALTVFGFEIFDRMGGNQPEEE